MPVAGSGEFHWREALNRLVVDLGQGDKAIIDALFWPSCRRSDSSKQGVECQPYLVRMG